GLNTIPMVIRIPLEARTRTLLVFTTWSATSGNGPKIVMPTPMRKRRRMEPPARTQMVACVSIAAVAGCIPHGFSVQLLVKGIQLIFEMSSWVFASLGHCHEIYETKTNLLFVTYALARSHRFRQGSMRCRSQSTRRHDFEGNLFRNSQAGPGRVAAASEQPRPQIMGRHGSSTGRSGNQHTYAGYARIRREQRNAR